MQTNIDNFAGWALCLASLLLLMLVGRLDLLVVLLPLSLALSFAILGAPQKNHSNGKQKKGVA
jgi:hypothetical protein